MSAIQYSYFATKSGKVFKAGLKLGEELLAEAELGSIRAVKKWAKAEAEKHKWLTAAPDVHTETHYTSGSVTV